MASNGSQERLVRINGRIKWTEVGNHDILECKKQAQRLVNSENPPRFDNGRKKGYMGIMKQLWEEKGYGYLELTEQNLRDQAAKLEKTLGNVRQRISENIRTRARSAKGTKNQWKVFKMQIQETKICIWKKVRRFRMNGLP